VIVVAGEVLIDLVVSPDGRVEALPGGGPYNTARSLARLAAQTTFLGRVGTDGFGRLLRDQFTREGVALSALEPSRRPTTLAIATLDRTGIASYSFYLDGTAAADLEYGALAKALPPDLSALYLGGLGLVMEPSGTSIEALVRASVPAEALVFLDPNCRPTAVTNEEGYRNRMSAVTRRADIVKASVEDLDYLFPGEPAAAAARDLLRGGVSLVLVTDGPRPARAFLPEKVLSEAVPAVAIADTIGAGDAFGGAFLAWWTERGLGRTDLRDGDLVGEAVRFATAGAALTCTRPGADPPTLAELRRFLRERKGDNPKTGT
jgi:fructokinase